MELEVSPYAPLAAPDFAKNLAVRSWGSLRAVRTGRQTQDPVICNQVPSLGLKHRRLLSKLTGNNNFHQIRDLTSPFGAAFVLWHWLKLHPIPRPYRTPSAPGWEFQSGGYTSPASLLLVWCGAWGPWEIHSFLLKVEWPKLRAEILH